MAVSLKHSVEQLDFLRGIAISMMIINHVGTRLLAKICRRPVRFPTWCPSGASRPSCLFYDGLWNRFCKARHQPRFPPIDLTEGWTARYSRPILFWRTARPWGLDFLGFIAISSVLVTSIAVSRKPIWLCVTIIVSVLAIRFGLGTWFRGYSDLPGFETWLVGARGIDRISYPFSPWII